MKQKKQATLLGKRRKKRIGGSQNHPRTLVILVFMRSVVKLTSLSFKTTVRVQLMIRLKKAFRMTVEATGIEIIDLLCLKFKMKGLCLEGKTSYATAWRIWGLITDPSRQIQIVPAHHHPHVISCLLIAFPTSGLTRWTLLLLSTSTTKSLRLISKVVIQPSRKSSIRSTTAQLPEFLGRMSVCALYYFILRDSYFFPQRAIDSLIPFPLA